MSLLEKARRVREQYAVQPCTVTQAEELSRDSSDFCPECAKSVKSAKSPPWDQVLADATLSQVNARIDALAAQLWRIEAQRRILEVFRVVFARYHAKQNPLLFDALGDVENQVGVIWASADP